MYIYTYIYMYNRVCTKKHKEQVFQDKQKRVQKVALNSQSLLCVIHIKEKLYV